PSSLGKGSYGRSKCLRKSTSTVARTGPGVKAAQGSDSLSPDPPSSTLRLCDVPMRVPEDTSQLWRLGPASCRFEGITPRFAGTMRVLDLPTSLLMRRTERLTPHVAEPSLTLSDVRERRDAGKDFT